MNFKLKYRLTRLRVKIRRIYSILSFHRTEKYASDIDIAIKIVKRMILKENADIRYSSMSSIFHVKLGHLYAKISETSITIINGKRYDWNERDIFCIPSWAWHEHHNLSETEDACLFQFNDLPVIESLGLFQSRELEENNGHQQVQ